MSSNKNVIELTPRPQIERGGEMPWRQDAPRYQLIVLLSSIQGDIDNLIENAGAKEKALQRIAACARDMESIISQYMPKEVEWNI